MVGIAAGLDRDLIAAAWACEPRQRLDPVRRERLRVGLVLVLVPQGHLAGHAPERWGNDRRPKLGDYGLRQLAHEQTLVRR